MQVEINLVLLYNVLKKNIERRKNEIISYERTITFKNLISRKNKTGTSNKTTAPSSLLCLREKKRRQSQNLTPTSFQTTVLPLLNIVILPLFLSLSSLLPRAKGKGAKRMWMQSLYPYLDRNTAENRFGCRSAMTFGQEIWEIRELDDQENNESKSIDT